jgi:hypothetical protein
MYGLPDTIKCGAHIVSITYNNELAKRYDSTASYSSLDMAEICIQEDLPQERKVWHLWTQTMRFMWALLCPETPQELLHCIGRMLLGLFRDNPLLLDANMTATLKEIVIYGFEYEVIDMPSSWANNAEYAPAEHTVRVNSVLKRRERWLSILHEVIHAAFDLAGAGGHIEEESEKDVVRLTEKLGALFVDNDMTWLIERERQ